MINDEKFHEKAGKFRLREADSFRSMFENNPLPMWIYDQESLAFLAVNTALYHLSIETPDANLSKGMCQLNSVYPQTYNHTHKRGGHVFQGRYKAILVEKESYLLNCHVILY